MFPLSPTAMVDRLKVIAAGDALNTNYMTWSPSDYVRFIWNDIESIDGSKHEFPLLIVTSDDKYFVASGRQGVPPNATHWAIIPLKP